MVYKDYFDLDTVAIDTPVTVTFGEGRSKAPYPLFEQPVEVGHKSGLLAEPEYVAQLKSICGSAEATSGVRQMQIHRRGPPASDDRFIHPCGSLPFGPLPICRPCNGATVNERALLRASVRRHHLPQGGIRA